jgi:hypothetical protein
MILFEPDFHVLIELLLSGQSLLWFHLKGNIIFCPFGKSFFSCNVAWFCFGGNIMFPLFTSSHAIFVAVILLRGISFVSSSSLSSCNLHCCAHLEYFTLRRAASEIGIQKFGHN